MERTQWVEQACAGLPQRDCTLLERASRTLEGNIIDQPDMAWAPHRGICPSPRTYKGVWNWDAAFHMLAVSRWDAELARDQARIFFGAQLDDGMFPDVLFVDGKAMDTYSKPPVFPWACQQVDMRCPDDAFLAQAYSAFVRNEQFWRTKRFVESEGLFHYDASTVGKERLDHIKWESGWDTSVRWDETIDGLWAVDLNAYMVLFYDAMAYMAERLERPADSAEWRGKRRALADRIETKLWDSTVHCYCDAFRGSGKPSPVQSPAAFVPLFAGVASAEHAADMARLAADPDKFWPGLPTVAYDDPAYDSADYWRGPMWLNMAYFAIEGLYRYGYQTLSAQLREQVLAWCAAEEGSIFEYYDSRTGKGLGARDFGWSAAFLIELILAH